MEGGEKREVSRENLKMEWMRGEDIEGNGISSYDTGWEQIRLIDHRWMRGMDAQADYHLAKCMSLPPKTTLP